MGSCQVMTPMEPVSGCDPTDPDVYRVLQVDPAAETLVLDASFRALARRYHPDGEAPDPARMAVLNRAYALVRSPEPRGAYDRSRQRLVAVGPGLAAPPWTAQPTGDPSAQGPFARTESAMDATPVPLRTPLPSGVTPAGWRAGHPRPGLPSLACPPLVRTALPR